MLLSGFAVLVLSGTQIRRSLVPMAELREGTSRIAQRDFGSRVRVTSRDEFEELAAAFNGMASQLGRQFQALSTAAEIDRAVLSATDVASIVDTLLARTRDVFPCHMVGVTLVAPDGGKSLSCVVYDYCDDARQARVDLRSDDVQDLLDGPDWSRWTFRTARTRPTSRPFSGSARVGPGAPAPLPAAAGRHPRHRRSGRRGAGADERLQLRRLADQVAVALANARMLEQVRSLAFYDSLTGLPNRLSYKERLARALVHARTSASWWRRSSSTSTTSAGSTTRWATMWATSCSSRSPLRLRASCRDREDEVGPALEAMDPDVARLGGDEFTVIIPGSPTRRTRPSSPAASCEPRPPDPPGRPGGLRQRQHRHRHLPRRRRGHRDAADARRHGDVQGEGAGGQQLSDLLPRDEREALQRLTLENALRRALEREDSSCTTSRSSTPGPACRSGRRRWCAGAIRSWDCCSRPSSSRWPRRTASSCRSASGCCGTACAQNRAWQDAGLTPIRVVVNLSSRQLAGASPRRWAGSSRRPASRRAIWGWS